MSTDEIDNLIRELIDNRDKTRQMTKEIVILAMRQKIIIRKLVRESVTQAEIAAHLAVTPARVNQILHGRKKK